MVRMPTKQNFLLAMLAVMNGMCSPAHALEITCPSVIAIHQNILKAPEGWMDGPASQRDHMLDYMSLGIIHSTSQLGKNDLPMREDDEQIKGHISTTIWKTDGSNAIMQPGEVYAVFCQYHSTDVLIAKPLPPAIKECSIIATIDKWNRYHFIKAVCK